MEWNIPLAIGKKLPFTARSEVQIHLACALCSEDHKTQFSPPEISAKQSNASEHQQNATEKHLLFLVTSALKGAGVHT